MTDRLAKLRRCVLLLSSEHDGEVVAAARSINRLLGSAGYDWHWLAERIDGGAEPADWQARIRDAFERGRKAGLAEGGQTTAADDHQHAAQWLLDNHGRRLRAKDRDFLDTMLNWPGTPTERQQAWLDDLCRRFGYRP